MILSEVVFTHIQEGIIVLNKELEVMKINPWAQKIILYNEDEVKGVHISSFFIEHSDFQIILSHMKENSSWEGEVWKKRKNGELFQAWININSVLDENNDILYYLIAIRDLTKHEIKQNITKIANKVFENTGEGIMITDVSGKIISVNPAFELVTGYSNEEVVGKNPKFLQSGIHDQQFYQTMWKQIHEQGYWKGEIWNKRKNGEPYPEWIAICAIHDDLGKLINYVGTFTDITDRKYAEKQLRYLAHYDSLTGVANRHSLNERLEGLIHTAEKYGQQLAVLFLDLDRFKQINDTLGHNYGDLLLKSVSSRLKGLVKNKDMIARLGGDEFVIVLPNIKHPNEAIHTASQIIEALTKSFYLNKQEVYVSTSIGISLYPLDGENKETLLRNADKAMYKAKSGGRNQFELYHVDFHRSKPNQRNIENNLRKAIERNEFFLVYHPIMNVETNEIVSVEALVRWKHEEIGVVSPAEFIPIAEETGLIIPISEWIMKQACQDLKILQLNGFPRLRMGINISALHFNQENFIKSVECILQETGIKSNYIEFELTESMIMPNAVETVDKLVKLKKLGIKLSIDDFGTGYSSLSYLNRFPIDTLKIDQSFIQGLALYKDNSSIVEAIIMMAHRLNLAVIAEGVENIKQLKILKKEKCDFIQGYLITKPIELEPLLQFLNDFEQELLE